MNCLRKQLLYTPISKWYGMIRGMLGTAVLLEGTVEKWMVRYGVAIDLTTTGKEKKLLKALNLKKGLKPPHPPVSMETPHLMILYLKYSRCNKNG